MHPGNAAPERNPRTRACTHPRAFILLSPPLRQPLFAFFNLQAEFERALSVWAAARTKHHRLLRPAFGSADRRDELDDLLALEAGRASEASAAIASFSRELMREEAAAAKDHAARIAECFGGVAAILDRYFFILRIACKRNLWRCTAGGDFGTCGIQAVVVGVPASKKVCWWKLLPPRAYFNSALSPTKPFTYGLSIPTVSLALSGLPLWSTFLHLPLPPPFVSTKCGDG